MADYEPILKDLAPRDVVARAIYAEMKKEGSTHVYLDITHKSKEELLQRFPTIYKKCMSIGLDMSKDYIPVAPVEHFLCGGIETNADAETTISGVYAVGECANTGVHGANRHASNSLLECLVFGARAAKKINGSSKDIQTESCIEKEFKLQSVTHIQKELRDLVETCASIIRTQNKLEYAKEKLLAYKIEGTSFESYEVLNQWMTTTLVVTSASQRKESVGCHTIEENV